MTQRRCALAVSFLCLLIGACQSTPPSPSAARTLTPRPILKVTATALPPTPTPSINLLNIPLTTRQGTCSPWPKSYTGCILDFTVTPTQVVAGENMTFTWAVTGGITVGLELFDHQGTLRGRGLRSWANLPVSGSLTVQMTDTQRGVYHFVLWADSAEVGAHTIAAVYYNCIDAPFFTPAAPYYGPFCPAGPAVPIQVTQQSFEHGLMLWLDSQDAVYVLYNRDPFPPNGISVWTYNLAEKITEAENDPDAAPPSGKYRPVNMLGGVWQKYSLLQSLGWALAPEQTFTSPMQVDYPGWPFYLRTAEGRILAIDYHWGPHYDDPSWSYLTP